jgi:hypothetical protein
MVSKADSGCTVLVVDDDAFSASIYEAILSD